MRLGRYGDGYRRVVDVIAQKSDESKDVVGTPEELDPGLLIVSMHTEDGVDLTGAMLFVGRVSWGSFENRARNDVKMRKSEGMERKPRRSESNEIAGWASEEIEIDVRKLSGEFVEE